jgi:hypothetical protein
MSLLASKPVQKPTLAVNDPMSGFFVLQRKCISGLEFQLTGFKLLLEILARGHISSVTAVPFKFAPRQKTVLVGDCPAQHHLPCVIASPVQRLLALFYAAKSLAF